MENGVTTYYPVPGFESKLEAGVLKNTTYFYANGEMVARKDPDNSMHYYHGDQLGSTSVITDASGGVEEKTKYYPFGALRSGGAKTKYLFNGKELASATGLYDYLARWYNPVTMHYTTPDDIIQNPYDPQTLNRYSYVKNNPVKYTDPTGHYVNVLAGAMYCPGVGLIVIGGVGFVYFSSKAVEAAVDLVDELTNNAADPGNNNGENTNVDENKPNEDNSNGKPSGQPKVPPIPSKPEKTDQPANSGEPTNAQSTTVKPGSLSDLPSEASDTMSRIKNNGPYTYSKDGTTFVNTEGRLPTQSKGYYKEYTVDTPGRADRAERRIVTGGNGEIYYTDDHYETFIQVQ